ncbi:hypothetical protein AB5I41_10590 [Sphingomonas sp. MMS24-JH45]
MQGAGELTDDQFAELLRTYLDCCRQFAMPDAAIFACMDWRSAHVLTIAAGAAGLRCQHLRVGQGVRRDGRPVAVDA